MRGKTLRLSVLRANFRSSGKRLWAAGIAVAVSVAFIVAGLLLVDSLTRGVTQQAEQDAAGVDLIVSTGHAEEGGAAEADEVLAEEIGQLDPVEATETIRTGWLDQMHEDDELYGQTDIGFPVSTLAESRQHELTSGELPRSAGELLINEAAAEIHGLAVGDRLTASARSWDEDQGYTLLDQAEFTVVGVTEAGRWDEGFLTAEGMRRLPQEGEGTVTEPDHVRVVLAGDAHHDPAAQEAVRDEIAELTDLDIATHQEIVDQWVAAQTGDAQLLQWVAFGFGGIAVFVSGLVIANTFQVIVASRLRTMALIRAVGGTAAQLRRATLAEGTLLGLLGGAIGVMLGWGVAQGCALAMNNFGGEGQGVPPVLLTPLAIGLGLGIGLLMAVGSALFPSLKAGRVSPMAALRPADVTPPEQGVSMGRVLIGTVLAVLGLGGVLYVAIVQPRAPEGGQFTNAEPMTGMPLPVLGVVSAIIGFLGVLVLAKLVIPSLVAWFGRGVAGLGIARVPAKLAGQNARQVPGRTAATSAALLVGVTLVVTMTVGAATAQKLMSTELSESHPVDGVVSGDVTEELREDDRIAEAAHAPGVRVGLGEDAPEESGYRLIVIDRAQHSPVFHGEWPFPETVQPGTHDAYAGYELIPYAGDNPGNADSGQLLDVEFPSGDQVQLTLKEGWASMPGDLIAVESATLGEAPGWFDAEDEDGATLVRLAEGVSDTELQALVAQLGEAGAEDISFDGGFARAGYLELIDMLLIVVLALLGASVFVAVIGVGNTLSLSVFERKREASLLRASGMTRRSLGATIGMEALLLAVVALVLGSGLGTLFGWAGVSTLTVREDWAVMLEIPWLRLAAIWGVTLVAALTAAWLPARRLSRVQPAAGLSQAA